MKSGICALACALAAVAAAAQEPAAPGTAAQAQVDSGTPYRRAYDMMEKVAREGRGRVAVLLQLSSPDGKPIPGLKLWVSTRGRDIAVAVDADGTFVLPLLPAGDVDEAVIHRNIRRELMLGVDFEPRVPDGVITARFLAESIDAGTSALHAVVPWYARAFVPAIRGLGICLPSRAAAEAERRRLLPDGTPPPIVAEKAREADPEPRYCIALAPAGTLAAGKELRPVPQATFQYLSTRF